MVIFKRLSISQNAVTEEHFYSHFFTLKALRPSCHSRADSTQFESGTQVPFFSSPDVYEALLSGCHPHLHLLRPSGCYRLPVGPKEDPNSPFMDGGSTVHGFRPPRPAQSLCFPPRPEFRMTGQTPSDFSIEAGREAGETLACGLTAGAKASALVGTAGERWMEPEVSTLCLSVLWPCSRDGCPVRLWLSSVQSAAALPP